MSVLSRAAACFARASALPPRGCRWQKRLVIVPGDAYNNRFDARAVFGEGFNSFSHQGRGSL